MNPCSRNELTFVPGHSIATEATQRTTTSSLWCLTNPLIWYVGGYTGIYIHNKCQGYHGYSWFLSSNKCHCTCITWTWMVKLPFSTLATRDALQKDHQFMTTKYQHYYVTCIMCATTQQCLMVSYTCQLHLISIYCSYDYYHNTHTLINWPTKISTAVSSNTVQYLHVQQ